MTAVVSMIFKIQSHKIKSGDFFKIHFEFKIDLTIMKLQIEPGKHGLPYHFISFLPSFSIFQSAASSSGGGASALATGGEGESDDSEVGRLQGKVI